MSNEATSGRPPLPHQDDMFDSLADLFLGDDQHATRRPTPRTTIQTRGLVVGHLPVMASAWIAQHARDLTKTLGGPVAVIARSGGHVTIDLHGITSRIPAAESFDAAIHAAMNAGVRAWLLRTDAVTELALAETPGLDGISILTGHDEAALVAAYRALKGLTASATDFDPCVPDIHIAVLGATDDQGRPAAEKLRRAAESFLQTGLASVTITPKIEGGSAARIYDGQSELDIDQLIDHLPTEHESPSTVTHAATPDTIAHGAPQSHLRLAHGDSDHASRIGPFDTAKPEPAQPEPAQPEQSRPAEATPSHAGAIASVRPTTTNATAQTLAPLLGLTPLEPRCPYADEVELAADTEGRAHLIIHAEGSTHTLAGALESLEIARSWLAAHLTLLAAATNNAVRVSPPLDPAAHLVVDHAAGARRLLDSPTRLYVLARGRAESLCVPLN